MSKLTLDSVEWKEFKLIDIFDIKDGYYNKKPPIDIDGDIPFLGATKYDNGITGYYNFQTIKKWDKVGNINSTNFENRLYDGNCLAITNNGSIGNIYYQLHQFTYSHDVTPVYLKNKKLNKFLAQFLATMLKKTSESFEYAKKWRPERMRKSKLLLPITSDGSPNWQFMEDYIKQEMKKQSQKIVNYYEDKLLKLGFELLDYEVEWKAFKVKDLFDVKSVKGKAISHYKSGNTPYISTSSLDNGLNNFVDTEEGISLEKCISIDPIGGKAFFHNYKFIGRGGAGSAINLLYNKNINENSSLFICKMLESSSTNKASYGVQLNGNRLKNLKLILPIDKTGNPHWKYMSNFVKKLEKENIEKTLKYIYIYI
ncbi:restriction endonuclease subunit S [Gemella cuniculi]|uniref:restriction endonuclease subunit S n=1 Tax=Gemella cuniculi TaxID=150240 RepID=UPI0003FFAD43|nr:restriction endonuclease subunit S [Gemella cuniculi]